MNKKCGKNKNIQRDALPIFVEKVWGGREIGRLFGVKLPAKKLIGEWWVLYDKKYPVVVKIIDVKQPLSVQVHPYGKNGKSELWYILKAGVKANVLGGISLNKRKVKAGYWVYLPGGTVHTILPPCVLLEVSQPNLITYRLYDWGRGTRPLDIEEGIKNIKLDAQPKLFAGGNRFSCRYFKASLKKLRRGDFSRFRGYIFVIRGNIKVGNQILYKGRSMIVDGLFKALSYSDVFCVSWMTSSSRARF